MIDTQNQEFLCSLFGHTVTMIGKDEIIVLGGAFGDPSQYKVKDTNFIFNITETKWRIGQQLPEAKAAHAACSFNSNYIIVFGGIQQLGTLATNDMYMYLMNQNEWQVVPIKDQAPQGRYGHTLCFHKPFIILYGGNNGQENLDETWTLDTSSQYLKWELLQFDLKPKARLYHTANMCPKGQTQGMMIIFGGRCNQSMNLNDLWGLVRHRNNQWEWQKAPIDTQNIQQRSQHCGIFIENYLFFVGGRCSNNQQKITIDMYDTDSTTWHVLNYEFFRVRHCIVYNSGSLYIFGGFDQQNQVIQRIDQIAIAEIFQDNNDLFQNLENQINKSFKNLRCTTPEKYQVQTPNKRVYIPQQKYNLPQDHNNIGIRMGSQVEVAFNLEYSMPTIKKIQINLLQDEWKKIGHQDIVEQPISQIQVICNQFIQQILQEKNYIQLKQNQINIICSEIKKILQQEQTLLQLRTPIKIFGNIHGNLDEIIRIFENYGYPHDNKNGDIERMNYLFLGDYVDRGMYSIETILLIFCLKISYPYQIYLLRGNHEDRAINRNYGFGEECEQKYKEDIFNDNSVFQMINLVFEYMPLAAILDDKYFCVHGGIGQTCFQTKLIQNIKRPIRDIVCQNTNQQIQLIQDLLWSDLAYQNEKMPFKNENREIPGQNLKYGTQQIKNFLNLNQLQCIIRSHESCEQGYEKIDDMIVTVFSVSNYCGVNQNLSAILLIKKNGEIVPKQLKSDNKITNWRNVRKVTPERQK